MTSLFKHRANYFCGRHSLTSKTVAFFSKEKDLHEWLKESWKRSQISTAKAHEILGKDFARAFKNGLDKEIVEPDPEYKSLVESRIKKVKKIAFNPYRDYNINYKGERF